MANQLFGTLGESTECTGEVRNTKKPGKSRKTTLGDDRHQQQQPKEEFTRVNTESFLKMETFGEPQKQEVQVKVWDRTSKVNVVLLYRSEQDQMPR